MKVILFLLILWENIKIHPLTIIFILLSAGNLLGIVGVILGIPGYAILKVLASHIFLLFKRRYNKYYGDDAGQYEIKKKNIKITQKQNSTILKSLRHNELS